MTCKCCQTARSYPEYRMFDPACLYCGARLIQFLARLPIGQTECTQRRRAMLALWIEHGHNEQEIRRLVKGPLAIGPDARMESDRRPSTKHLSATKK